MGFVRWLYGPLEGKLWPRWIFLRLLGLWFFSAFYSLWFQVRGLVGPDGLLPAGDYLRAVAEEIGAKRYWEVPTVFWWGHDGALLTVCALGAVASLLLIVNVWPRAATAVATLCFLSFVSVLQDFASYQSDGMLLEAGLISIFFAPAGFRPGLGAESPPPRLAHFALQWLWLRIYFESGVVKLLSHDPQWWPDLTAMDHYYENGPLPSFLGWYSQELLPHAFHAATAFLTLAMELVLVWAFLLPRRFRLVLFCLVTPFQIGIIATSNYAFLNYLVLSLGVLLLDDRVFASTGKMRSGTSHPRPPPAKPVEGIVWRLFSGFVLTWQLYAVTVLMTFGALPLPTWPAALLEPSRFAGRYGLFATMTRERDEIEFQGSNDGAHWTSYLFRYKPQDPKAAPGLYAPYQPRFEWNLWFASLGRWQRDRWVVRCEERLLQGSKDVLALFRGDPFQGAPPIHVRTRFWHYRFSTPAEKAKDGSYWQRDELGDYAPALKREADGTIVADEG